MGHKLETMFNFKVQRLRQRGSQCYICVYNWNSSTTRGLYRWEATPLWRWSVVNHVSCHMSQAMKKGVVIIITRSSTNLHVSYWGHRGRVSWRSGSKWLRWDHCKQWWFQPFMGLELPRTHMFRCVEVSMSPCLFSSLHDCTLSSVSSLLLP